MARSTPMPIDLDNTEEIFAASTDLTVGLEEEFAVLDAGTLDLVPRFEELRDAANISSVLSRSIGMGVARARGANSYVK